jgi:hypothetical protein
MNTSKTLNVLAAERLVKVALSTAGAQQSRQQLEKALIPSNCCQHHHFLQVFLKLEDCLLGLVPFTCTRNTICTKHGKAWRKSTSFC